MAAHIARKKIGIERDLLLANTRMIPLCGGTSRTRGKFGTARRNRFAIPRNPLCSSASAQHRQSCNRNVQVDTHCRHVRQRLFR